MYSYFTESHCLIFVAPRFLVQPDVQISTKKRSRKSKENIEWPDLDSLDMALLSTTMGVHWFFSFFVDFSVNWAKVSFLKEEMEARVPPYAGRITPAYDSDSELEVEEQITSSDGDETRAIGSSD